MASILLINGKWRAQVRRTGFKTKSKTFPTKKQAEAWGRQIEADMDAGGDIKPLTTSIKIIDVIEAYRKLRDASRPISDTSNEHYMLKALTRGLGEKMVARLTPQDMVDYAVMRREEGAGPYTINMDISKLGTVMRYGAVSLRVVLPDIVGAARPLLNHLRLIGGGGKRERRPTDDELLRILAHMDATYGHVYAEAVAFSAVSAMRRGEVCAIEFKDIDELTRIVSVMRKHPRKGKTLERVPLLGEAWDIVQRQPKDNERIFPIQPTTLSKYFTWTCRDLNIPDLHLHDMRHEGTSRLFEDGFAIQQAALVTGHKDWRNLQRYTNLKPEDLTKREDQAAT